MPSPLIPCNCNLLSSSIQYKKAKIYTQGRRLSSIFKSSYSSCLRSSLQYHPLYVTLYLSVLKPKFSQLNGCIQDVQVSAHNLISLCFLFVFAERGCVSPRVSEDVICLQKVRRGKFWLCEYVILKLKKKTTFKTHNIFLENSLYAMGGFDSTNYQSSVERLDPRQIINTTQCKNGLSNYRNFY